MSFDWSVNDSNQNVQLVNSGSGVHGVHHSWLVDNSCDNQQKQGIYQHNSTREDP